MSWAGFSRRLFESARMSSAASRPSRANRSSSGNPSRAHERTSSRLSAITLSSCSLALARWSAMLCMPRAAACTSGPAASIKAWVLRAEAASSVVAPRSSATRAFRSCTVCGSVLLAFSRLPSVLETACRLASLSNRSARCTTSPAAATSSGKLARNTSKRDGPEQVDVQQPGDSLQLQLRHGVRRYRRGGIDVDDHLDAAGIARVDVQFDHAADTDTEVTHRRAPLEAADAAAEVNLVAVVAAVLAGVGIPVDEQRSQQRHQQHEGTDRGVVRFTFHVRLPGARARARRGNRP